MSNNLYRIKDLASALGSSEPYVRKLVKEGKIEVQKSGGVQVVDISLETNTWLRDKMGEKRKGLKAVKAQGADIEELEKKLWGAADLLRGNIDSSQYKHVCLGLIFLKYVSDQFDTTQRELEQESALQGTQRAAFLRDKKSYRAKNAFFIPEKSRWEHLQNNASKATISTIIDSALKQIEDENQELVDVLWREYTKTEVDPTSLGELINVFSTVDFNKSDKEGLEILGRIYEYFIGQFADSEGKRGGEFFTPISLVKTIVAIVQPKGGETVFDPACGSGGLLVQAGKYAEETKRGSRAKIRFQGQEFNSTTQKLAKMNAVIHGMNADIRQGNSYYDDKFKDQKADVVIANPPFNDNWSKERISEDDERFKYGLPNEGNANLIWVQHFIYHMKDTGRAGFVMANGSLSASGKERDIRQKIVEDDLVEVIISCPAKLFYNVAIPSCLWFLSRDKSKKKGKTLFIDASNLYNVKSKKHVEFTDEHIQKIADTVTKWREGKGYKDELGFCYSATLKEIGGKDFSLVPSSYVGFAEEEDDGIPFETKMKEATNELKERQEDAERAQKKIKKTLSDLGLKV